VRCAEVLDVEPLEQGPRREGGRGQLSGDVVVYPLGAGAGELLAHAEQVGELGAEPQAGRRAAEEVEVLGKRLPDAAMVALDRTAVARRDAEILQRDALAV